PTSDSRAQSGLCTRHLGPYLLLILLFPDGDLQRLGRNHHVRCIELLYIFVPALGPSALLHAERRDREFAGIWRQYHVLTYHSILLAAFDDITRLDIDLLVGSVFNRPLLHLECFE